MAWNLYYRIEEGQAELLRCTGAGAELTLPEQIEGCPVTALADSCLEVTEPDAVSAPEEVSVTLTAGLPPENVSCGVLKRLHLPKTLKRIGARAFYGQTLLPRAELPDGLEHIGEKAFYRCKSLRHLEIPEGVTVLPRYLAGECSSLERMELPRTLIRIDAFAFYYCISLEEIRIPDAVQSAGGNIFMNCRNLKRVWMPERDFLSNLLEDVDGYLEISLTGPEPLKLVFPEYLVEYEDLVMPRQFRMLTYGSGYQYRLCVDNRGIDLERYDEQFPRSVREDKVPVAAQLARFRLQTPRRLSPSAKKSYEAYLEQHWAEAAGFWMEQEDDDAVLFLLTLPFAGAERLETLMELAAEKRKVRYVSLLMEEKRARFGSAEKEFEL